MIGCRKAISLTVIIAFIITTLTPFNNASAAVAGLPIPGTMVNLSSAYTPLLIKGLRVHPDNPLLFDFIIDTGNSAIKNDSKDLRAESEKLIKYFLATLTIPEKDLWVNLSPYEKDRIIEEPLGQTELGRDMLAQDYMLKQLTASLIYPEKELGKKFWDKVYAQARERFGVTNIPVNTFNKVWIMPDQADIFVRNNTAYVVGTHLKVMLEEDYLAANKNDKVAKNQNSQIIRDVILPEIEREVNTGKNFAPLRQIFNSIVLASWYKQNLKQALLNQVYTNKSKINGVDTDDKAVKEKIYEQYLQAYKKGVFNYIKENSADKGVIEPRKYFSGGEVFTNVTPRIVNASPAMVAPTGPTFLVNVAVEGSDSDTSAAQRAALAAHQLLSDPSKKRMDLAREVELWYLGQRMLAGDDKVTFDEDTAARALSHYENFGARKFTSTDIRRILTYTQVGYFPDAAMEAGEITASTVTAEDFQQLVELRAKANAGFHLNVDPMPVIPASASAVENISELSLAEKERLKRLEASMYKNNQIGEIVMVGGEATRFGGPKTFVSVDETQGEFLQIKAANLRWARNTLGTTVPMYLLASEKRLPEFKEALEKRQYYGMTSDSFQFYTQGVVDTFIPTDEEIKANFKGTDVEKNLGYAATMRKANPDGIYRFKGERRLVPGGHFDAIASFIISGRLTDALKQGIEFAPVFNIDNLQAVLKNDGLIAHFAEEGYDFGFLLAEKNLTFTVKDSQGNLIKDKIIVRFKDNVISFDGIHEFKNEAVIDGFRFVINVDSKNLDVFDTQNRQVTTVQSIKPETGGTLVQPIDSNGNPVGNPTMKEGFELKSDFPHADAPFFNTNTIIVRLKSLLKFLNVTEDQLAKMSFEERSNLVREQLVKQIKPNFEFKNHEVDGEYPELGVVKDGKTKIPVVQLTRIMLQVAHIKGAKVGYYFGPRASIFAPVKEPEDKKTAAANNAESLKLITDYRGDPMMKNPAMAAQQEQKNYGRAQMGDAAVVLATTLNQKPLTIYEKKDYVAKMVMDLRIAISQDYSLESKTRIDFQRIHGMDRTFSGNPEQLENNLRAMIEWAADIKKDVVKAKIDSLAESDTLKKEKLLKLKTLEREFDVLIAFTENIDQLFESFKVIWENFNQLDKGMSSNDQGSVSLTTEANKPKALSGIQLMRETLEPAQGKVKEVLVDQTIGLVILENLNTEDEPIYKAVFDQMINNDPDKKIRIAYVDGQAVFYLTATNLPAGETGRTHALLDAAFRALKRFEDQFTQFHNQMQQLPQATAGRLSLSYRRGQAQQQQLIDEGDAAQPDSTEQVLVNHYGFQKPEDLRVVINSIKELMQYLNSLLEMNDDKLRNTVTDQSGQIKIGLVSNPAYDEAYKFLRDNFFVQLREPTGKGQWLLVLDHEGWSTKRILDLEYGKIDTALGLLNIAFMDLLQSDRAQLTPGGIDLNTKDMKTNISGENITIQFDKAMIEQFKRGDFTGVRPVILNVTPITSVLPLLGLSPRRDDDVALGV